MTVICGIMETRARCIGKIIFQREHYSWQMYFAQQKNYSAYNGGIYWSVLKGYRRVHWSFYMASNNF